MNWSQAPRHGNTLENKNLPMFNNYLALTLKLSLTSSTLYTNCQTSVLLYSGVFYNLTDNLAWHTIQKLTNKIPLDQQIILVPHAPIHKAVNYFFLQSQRCTFNQSFISITLLLLKIITEQNYNSASQKYVNNYNRR